MNKNSWGYLVLSVLGAVAIVVALCVGLQYAITTGKGPVAPTEAIVTTSGGMQVKLGKVRAELVQTGIQVGSAGHMIVGLTEAPARIEQMFREAGGDTTTLLTGNLTICLGTVVAYNSELNGVVSAPVMAECRNFEPGQMIGVIITFAEDYTVKAKALYETKYSFINKESK